jgi:hypothetical protein
MDCHRSVFRQCPQLQPLPGLLGLGSAVKSGLSPRLWVGIPKSIRPLDILLRLSRSYRRYQAGNRVIWIRSCAQGSHQ